MAVQGASIETQLDDLRNWRTLDERDRRSEKNQEVYAASMAALSADGSIWVGHVGAGEMSATCRGRLRRNITVSDVEDSPHEFRGFWQHGKLHEFAPHLIAHAARIPYFA